MRRPMVRFLSCVPEVFRITRDQVVMIAPIRSLFLLALLWVLIASPGFAGEVEASFEPPEIKSSWDDLTQGLENLEQWRERRAVLKQRYLDLLRDQHKPERVPLDLQVHETAVVGNRYTRKLISYQVEADERAARVSGHSARP